MNSLQESLCLIVDLHIQSMANDSDSGIFSLISLNIFLDFVRWLLDRF